MIDFWKDKKVLILSPQTWGKMRLSKHHYAIELADAGAKVYFLNPPKSSLGNKIEIHSTEENDNLFVIEHELFFPYNLKFHVFTLYSWLMGIHVRRLQSAIGLIEVLWSFDLGGTYQAKQFTAKKKIFHPVDEPLNQMALDSAKDFDIVVSLTDEIIEKYKYHEKPSYFVNHGLAKNFLLRISNYESNALNHIGLSGNFTRPDFDFPTVIKIVQTFPDITFHFWGARELSESNISGSNEPLVQKYLMDLKNLKNAIFYGPVSTEVLVEGYTKMDAFLICYDIEKDQSHGTNYHKILEFLSTGKPVFSSNVTTYENRYPGMLYMAKSRISNLELVQLINNAKKEFKNYSNLELTHKRQRFAREHSYKANVQKIGEIIND